MQTRKPILDDDVILNVYQTLRSGSTLESAAAIAGVSTVAFFEWLRIGRKELKDRAFDLHHDDKERYVKLLYAVEKAHAEYEVNTLKIIDAAAAKGAWQAAAWRLERKFPKHYNINMMLKDEVITEEVDLNKIDVVVTDETDDKRLEQIENEIRNS